MKKRITKKTRLNLYLKFYHAHPNASKENYRISNIMTYNNFVLQYYTTDQIIAMMNSDEPLMKDLSDMTNERRSEYFNFDVKRFKLILEVALESRIDFQRQSKLNQLLD